MEMLAGPGCPTRPSFPQLSGVETDAHAQETLAPGDPLGQEACRACHELLQLQRLKRWVKGELEFPCLRPTCMGEMSPVASTLVDQGILHSPCVGF
jgi:hypothetical protein